MGKDSRFARGDLVVFRTEKRSRTPGPRARDVEPEPQGDDDHYFVDTYWVVENVDGQGQVTVRTRRGKRHVLEVGNHCLRRARWWEKLLHKERFPDLATLPEPVEGAIPPKHGNAAARPGWAA